MFNVKDYRLLNADIWSAKRSLRETFFDLRQSHKIPDLWVTIFKPSASVLEFDQEKLIAINDYLSWNVTSV